MTLKDLLRDRPVIYEIVPPRKDTSRFNTELRGVEDVLHDKRIAAVNVPELINRREQDGKVHYSPATIPPEEYALLIREYKESIVNIIAPRLKEEEFVYRLKKIIGVYGIPNITIVGKERHEDKLPGPSVPEALDLVRKQRKEKTAVGGICIFNRISAAQTDYDNSGTLDESRRVWLKARMGCDFVTSQITFDSVPALDFLSSYGGLCEETGSTPLTVFISLATVPSPSILSLLDSLDVVTPPRVRRRLLGSSSMGSESVGIATEVFREIVTNAKHSGLKVPIGLQVEQVGVNSGDLSLALLDSTYGILKDP